MHPFSTLTVLVGLATVAIAQDVSQSSRATSVGQAATPPPMLPDTGAAPVKLPAYMEFNWGIRDNNDNKRALSQPSTGYGSLPAALTARETTSAAATSVTAASSVEAQTGAPDTCGKAPVTITTTVTSAVPSVAPATTSAVPSVAPTTTSAAAESATPGYGAGVTNSSTAQESTSTIIISSTVTSTVTMSAETTPAPAAPVTNSNAALSQTVTAAVTSPAVSAAPSYTPQPMYSVPSNGTLVTSMTAATSNTFPGFAPIQTGAAAPGSRAPALFKVIAGLLWANETRL